MSFPVDLSLGLEGTHVLITGAAGAIGSICVQHFLAAGCNVTALDIRKMDSMPRHPNLLVLNEVDITNASSLTSFFAFAKDKFGVVQTCIALASIDYSYLPHHESLIYMSVDQWRRTMHVNVEGTFVTARTWLRQIYELATPETTNVSLIIVGSESGTFGERGNADYAAGKSAVQGGLMMSLIADVSRIHPTARVNAIAPGPVDTEQFRKECAENPDELYLAAQATVGLRTPVPIASVAKGMLFLASQAWSGHVSGQVLNVNSGKMGKVLWPDRNKLGPIE